MIPHKYTNKDKGRSVVYEHPHGDSVSATITQVNPNGNVVLRFAVPLRGIQSATVLPTDTARRLTLFPVNSYFLVC
jgi:hypothetical protein